MYIWTGFHWCSPLDTSRSDEARRLLEKSGRWGSVVLLLPNDDSNFRYALDRIMDARQAVGGGRSLNQTLVRIYYEHEVSFNSVQEAHDWLAENSYFDNLNYFVANGGRMVIVFNELNVTEEHQHQIDPRHLGYLAYALQNAYWNQGNRLLYTLFPGPSGLLDDFDFLRYFRVYALHTVEHKPRTFGEVYGNDVDPLLRDRTMLHHGGRGVFDRLSLHCYSWTPDELKEDNASGRKPSIGLRYLYLTKEHVDKTGWVYVTEVSGANATSYLGQYVAGKALADFEYNANKYYRLSYPYFLQGVYGYILNDSNDDAVSDAAHKISNTFIDGYNYRRDQLGF